MSDRSPWHDAQPGEFWQLNIDQYGHCDARVSSDGLFITSEGQGFTTDHAQIMGATKLSDRVDHKAKAICLLTTSPLTAEAQVHATLYLAEQQRITNLMTYYKKMPATSSTDATVLLSEIREGLGLS